jgi:hypothetical protein
MSIAVGSKVAKVASEGSKMATRWPSTGLKAAKMANLMRYSAVFAVFAAFDTLLSGGR